MMGPKRLLRVAADSPWFEVPGAGSVACRSEAFRERLWMEGIEGCLRLCRTGDRELVFFLQKAWVLVAERREERRLEEGPGPEQGSLL